MTARTAVAFVAGLVVGVALGWCFWPASPDRFGQTVAIGVGAAIGGLVFTVIYTGPHDGLPPTSEGYE